MDNKILVIMFVEFLLLLAIVGMFISLDNRITDVYKELKIELHEQQIELDDVQKKQRITSQDIDFLEKMCKGDL